MTSERKRPHEGGAPEAAAAKPLARGDSSPSLRAVARVSARGEVLFARGFFAKALSGKTRPGVREPATTHYMCDCCRWSA
jgi:hypothetical protein